jgi:pyruvate dehydrogenase E2 component (dihydrolipoamide acetyltransferase)
MAIPVIMPRQGQSVETCIITRWFKNKGEKVSSGDLLFAYETDKAAFELESPSEGTLLEIFFSEGAEVPVLVNVAVIGQPGEATALFKPEVQLSGTAAGTRTATEPVKEVAGPFEENIPVIPKSGKIRISPRAKHLAESKGLNYNNIAGSGPNGRIIVSDIEKVKAGGTVGAPQKKTPSGEFTEIPLSNVRKLIARAMHFSLQNSAQLTHHMSADARNLLKARQKIKEGIKAGTEKQDITLNDMICWCVIRALEKHPDANSHFLGDTVKNYNKVHLGIAVDTSRGLMVPAIKNADEMTLTVLSRELKNVADACRKGNISPELIQSTAASFTVSNLGNYGVEMFTPVINLPQAGILGVCAIISRPADLGNNTFGFVPFMGLSLTYDHRAIDGGPATMFLKEIKEQIESFSY